MSRVIHCLVIMALIFLTFSPLVSQELVELEYEKMSSKLIVDDPEVSMLRVESTIPGLQFNSRRGIKEVRETEQGIWDILLLPGVHYVEIGAPGHLLLKLERINFEPKMGQRIRVRARTILGSADRFNAERPTLRLNLTSIATDETYVKLDDNPPQKVDFTAGFITLRPAPGNHLVQVYVGNQMWEQTFDMEARGQYEATVQPKSSDSDALNIEQAGNIFVDSEPQGATVLLNNLKQEGQTPLLINDVQPGVYQIDIVLPQYQSAQRQIEVKSLEYPEVMVNLLPNFGKVVIDSNPSGAILYVDDDQVGVTPYQAQREVGQYRLRIIQPFYHELEDTLSVEVGSVFVATYALRPRFGQLLIRSNPSGARVLLDGNAIGMTPILQERISSGSHMLEVTLAPYETLRRSVTMEDGLVDTLNFDLEKTVGRLQVSSTPPGASVSIKESGRELGVTPIYNVALLEGGYTLEMSLEGYDKLERPVQMRRGQETVLKADLVRHQGMIRVESSPPRARISVNGKDYGKTTPTILRDLPTDTYQVRLELDGYDPSEARVEVKKDQITDHKVELTTQGVKEWRKRRGRARILALIPGMGLGQLVAPGQRLRGILYGISMAGALSLAQSANQSYDQARSEYEAGLQLYASAIQQEDIDLYFNASVDASNRMNTQADKFRLALTGAGVVYAAQLIDALLFGGGDVKAKQVDTLSPILQVSEGIQYLGFEWLF